jgi:hypothetical protein
MRSAVVISILALVVAAGAQATPRRGTLSGTVTRGPVTPVCAIEVPCYEPAPNVTLLFTRNETIVGRAVTDAEGHYRVRLPGGTYAVRRPAASTIDRRLDPNRVWVASSRTRHIDFSIDTGIR